jgi:hypothetical protein
MIKGNNKQLHSFIKPDPYTILTDHDLRKIIPAHSTLLDKRIQPTLDFFS